MAGVAGKVGLPSKGADAAGTKETPLETSVANIINPATRDVALGELSKKRERYADLAPMLWHSTATIAALLQEIVGIYPALSPPTLSSVQSTRVCNALALLQCVASHPETRPLFLKAHIPLYLYPFLSTQSKARQYEFLRLTSLGVIGALVKQDDPRVVDYLLKTEIIPVCLRIMETGSDLSMTVATFIVQKILMDDQGLSYICATPHRFFAVNQVLDQMVAKQVEKPSGRLLKHVVHCYHRLAKNERARDALRDCLPGQLLDGTFQTNLADDADALQWLSELGQMLAADASSAAAGGGGSAGGGGPVGSAGLTMGGHGPTAVSASMGMGMGGGGMFGAPGGMGMGAAGDHGGYRGPTGAGSLAGGAGGRPASGLSVGMPPRMVGSGGVSATAGVGVRGGLASGGLRVPSVGVSAGMVGGGAVSGGMVPRQYPGTGVMGAGYGGM